MPAIWKKPRLAFAGGVVMLMLATLLLLEKNGMAPSWFHLGKISERTWRRVRGTSRPALAGGSKKSRNDPDRWYAEILAKHPELVVTYKDVPDADNGFLQWLDFIDECKASGALDLPDDIEKMLRNPESWDSGRMAEWISQHQDLIEKIAELGLLPDQSVKGIDVARYRWVEPRLVINSNRLILASAKLAMENGDKNSALRYLRAAMGSASHFDGIETPSLINGTVATTVRMAGLHFSMDALSSDPGLSDQDLQQWQESLRSGSFDQTDLSHMMSGEWHQSMRMLLPYLSDAGEYPVSLPDPDAFIEARIGYHKAWLANIESSDLKSLSTSDVACSPPADLSKPGQDLLTDMAIGTNQWTHGWTRGRIEALQTQAAFAAALGQPIPLEPISGKPFVYDQTSGTVTMPGDPPPKGFELKPVKVPKVAP